MLGVSLGRLPGSAALAVHWLHADRDGQTHPTQEAGQREELKDSSCFLRTELQPKRPTHVSDSLGT